MSATDHATLLADDLEAGFDRLVRDYQDRLFAFALSLTENPSEAEEAAQATFVKSFRALREWPRQRILALRVEAWLFRIALNTVRNSRRGQRPLELFGTERASTPDPALAGELLELARELQALSPAQRDAVVLRHVRGMAYAEAAEVLELPVGTVKSNVHRGLEALRRRMSVEVGA